MLLEKLLVTKGIEEITMRSQNGAPVPGAQAVRLWQASYVGTECRIEPGLSDRCSNQAGRGGIRATIREVAVRPAGVVYRSESEKCDTTLGYRSITSSSRFNRFTITLF